MYRYKKRNNEKRVIMGFNLEIHINKVFVFKLFRKIKLNRHHYEFDYKVITKRFLGKKIQCNFLKDIFEKRYIK